jgi:hypothetical protein
MKALSLSKSAPRMSHANKLRIPITSTAHSSMDFDQCEQPFGWAMIGLVLINGQVAAKWR